MLWNVKQVANYLSISESMVYKMVSNRELPFIRLGDCIRFVPETVESFINRNLEIKMNRGILVTCEGIISATRNIIKMKFFPGKCKRENA